MSLLTMRLLQHNTSLFDAKVVKALPSGAAGCDVGRAAAGFHLDFGQNSSSGRDGDSEGDLKKYNTAFSINDEIMDPANVTLFTGGIEMNWTVSAEPDLPIRGVLLRVQPKDPNAEFTLTGDVNLQPARFCLSQQGNVEGITHRSRVKKQFVSGTMRFDNDGAVRIDLTVVYMNGRVAPENLSIFAHNVFTLNIQNSPPFVPVPVPVATPPTASPVEDRCMTNTCSAFLGLQGRLYNRLRHGQCRERCSMFGFFVSTSFGWQCGRCF